MQILPIEKDYTKRIETAIRMVENGEYPFMLKGMGDCESMVAELLCVKG